MKYNKELKLVDELAEIAEWDKQEKFGFGQWKKTFGLVAPRLTFMGRENVYRFDHIISVLFKSNKEIAETYTIDEFIRKIIVLVRDLKTNNRKCTTVEYETITASMLAIPIAEVEIFYDLHGGEMDSNEIEFGDFKIYHFERSLDKLIQEYPFLQNKEFTFTDRKSEYVLGIKTKARVNSKAAEITNRFCSQFENVFNYAIADLNHERSIGIFNFRGWTTTEVTVCGNDNYGAHPINQLWFPVNLEDPFFKKEAIGNDKIWGLITKENKTEIERRLLIAIEWIGKGVYDSDSSKALVQFVFAIESMLQFNEGSFLTPSIISQMGDWLAFIIEDEKEKRIQVVSHFKEIYKKRSGIAHGGDVNITLDDLHSALQLAKAMVVTFLTQKPFCEMRTMKELNEHITSLKFQ